MVNQEFELEVKNKWFLNEFLPSFGVCDKQISQKQADIFKRYLKFEDESLNYTVYYLGYLNGLEIRLQESRVFNGCKYYNGKRTTLYRYEFYLTIKKDNREEIEKTQKQLDDLRKQFYSLIELEKKCNDDEKNKVNKQLDDIEEQLDFLSEKLEKMF